ncbi:MAG: asparagine synthetase [Candidatus Lokiarchaeota archaeon]|nr:asparagine synthetase [Candidatus Lokiarchaeota archaeon]
MVLVGYIPKPEWCIMTFQTASTTRQTDMQTDRALGEIYKIQSQVLLAAHEFLHREGIVQMMPVMLSPVTDPLNHEVYDASIDYLGQKLQLTKSMILHKQIAIARLDVRGIYIISPNVRLEKGVKSDRHLLEFSQLDIEIRDMPEEDFRRLVEGLMVHIFSRVKEYCEEECLKLGIDIIVPQAPFRVYSSKKLLEKYGADFESKISQLEKDLFWITDFDREFYDREDPEDKGTYINYDLCYPNGYGEALSGGERDYEYSVLVRKILERGQDPKDFTPYLELARAKQLCPSSGGGLGIERLIRFLTKRKHIRETTLFPRVPEESIIV